MIRVREEWRGGQVRVPAEPIGVERLVPFAFTPFAHGYPTTILDRVSAGCTVNRP